MDGGVYVAKRETAINRARRRYHSERQWSFLTVDDSPLAFAAGVASLPADYNDKFDPLDVYFYSGNTKYCFEKVAWSAVPSYQSDRYVFATNKKASQIKTNHPEIAAATLSYTYLPPDKTSTTGSQDSDAEPAPDLTAIEFLSIGYWWLAKERDETKFASFQASYAQQLALDVADDRRTVPARFFRPRRPYLQKGYQSAY